MSDHHGELVYAVPRDFLFGGVEPWLGVRRDDVAGIMDRTGSGSFVPRSAAESDPGLKQIIPYLVLRDGERVFLMRRTRAGGDARLHDLFSIGVGGHLNPGDGSILGGLEREWAEEMTADFVPEFEFVGLLNDDSVEVGVHHLGIVFSADAAGRPVTVRETHKLSGSFESVGAARSVYDRMETWSQLVLETLEAVPPASPHPDSSSAAVSVANSAALSSLRALPPAEVG
jgi:predicted NUDIX family phosphoesterase